MDLLGDGTLLAIAVTIFSAFLAGHLLGGPDPQNRLALADAAATRHPGIAGLIAHRHFDEPKVMLAVILFLVAGLVLSALFGRWVRKRYGRPSTHPA